MILWGCYHWVSQENMCHSPVLSGESMPTTAGSSVTWVSRFPPCLSSAALQEPLNGVTLEFSHWHNTPTERCKSLVNLCSSLCSKSIRKWNWGGDSALSPILNKQSLAGSALQRDPLLTGVLKAGCSSSSLCPPACRLRKKTNLGARSLALDPCIVIAKSLNPSAFQCL